jgi:cyclopropane fatty-acyl-phospholipid synthase-like methyltransferase
VVIKRTRKIINLEIEMGYFDKLENVNEYIKMVDGYDGKELIKILEDYLDPGSTLLELGMGPGKDLDLLEKKYTVTGSDPSEVFLDLYRKKNPKADLLNIDALSLNTDRKFDCIYSNKVLHHLERDELPRSLERQRELLNPDGIAFHTFWRGSGEETHHDLLFVYYTQDDLTSILPDGYKIRQNVLYKEDKKDDSILLIIQKP